MNTDRILELSIELNEAFNEQTPQYDVTKPKRPQSFLP
jgi:hypothetical protein